MLIRLRYRKLGNHIHCRMFTAPGIDRTFAKNGDIVFDDLEWPTVREMFERGGISVLQEAEELE